MQPATAELDRIRALLPLLGAIAGEIEERSELLAQLLVERGCLRDEREASRARRRLLDAECALHRRELRQARRELWQLGCLIVSTQPCTFCISVGQGKERSVVFWQVGQELETS